MTYADKLKNPKWQKKRLLILQRDEFTCRDCGSTEKTLQVHHCHYDCGNPWEIEDDRILMTLCSDCHKIRQEWENRARRAFGVLLSQEHHSCLAPLTITMERLTHTCHDSGMLVVDALEFNILYEKENARRRSKK